MRSTRARTVKALAVLALVLVVSPVGAAGTGSVKGRVVLQQGALPSGIMVRATSIEGGSPLKVSLLADGTFRFTELPEGTYLFDLVGPDDKVFTPATRAWIPAAPTDLVLSYVGFAKRGSNLGKRVATYVAAVVAGGLAGYAIGDHCDPDASPSSPSSC
jgi:hypothetical protein